jgi:conjugal transfer pilus assembly protein TraV
MKPVHCLSAFAALAVLSGCSTLSGLDSKDSFKCPAVGGVPCESITEIYDRSQAGTLPAQSAIGVKSRLDNELSPLSPPTAIQPSKGVVRASLATPLAQSGVAATLNSGMPLRTTQRVLRIWLAPWEDSEGHLHDQSYIYVTVGDARWLPEHNKRRIMDAFGPVRSPGGVGATLPAKRLATDVQGAAVGTKTVSDIGAQVLPDATKDAAAIEMMRQFMGQPK